jgi:ABC-2 type transport system ATP-binding protein
VVINFSGVSKQYGGKLAVDQLDLTIAGGQLTALLGENGAGKTTSVSMALGLVKPSEGQVTVSGELAGSMPARRRVGAMLQSAELPEQLTPAEHIKLFQTYYANPVSFDELVETIGLQEILNTRYGVLSGGQKRRVQLALALCGNADFILLDEPTVGLDIDARHTFWDVIRRLVDAGRGVVLTTHYLEEADALADRILVMAEGHIIADGAPAEIKALTGGKIIELRTDAADEVLRNLTGVEAISQVGDRKQITTHMAEETLRALFANGCTVEDISVNRAGLEAAFLGLTNQNKQEKMGDAA